MLTEEIKQSESYQMFIKYSTGQIPPKKSRGKVHATHARIMTESVPKPTRRRKSSKVTFDPPKKLKGVPSLTSEAQEAADIMQALKESKKSSKRQPEQESEHSKEDKLDDKEKDEDEEMINVEVDDSDKDDEEVTDAAKADAEKTSQAKDDAKKTKHPPTSYSLSVSSIFGDQFFKLSFDSSLSLSMLSVPVSVISDPTILTPLQESPLIATVTTLPPLSVSTTPSAPQQITTPIPTPNITTKALIIAIVIFESDALYAQIPKLPKKQTPTVDLEQGFEKSASEILKIKREQPKKQQTPKFTIKSTDHEALNEYDQNSALYQTMHANKLDWNNPERDHYPFNVSKPLPLQGHPESYQKKLNITPPQQIVPEIKFKKPYTLSHRPPRAIYEDLVQRKRVMQADELYKLLDRTLKKVRDELHH
nr:hypothetical protein [Tanacetum cinerariifolium]